MNFDFAQCKQKGHACWQAGFAPVVAVILALIFIAGGVAGYIILSKPKFPVSAPPLPVFTSDQTSPEPEASTADETAGWSDYKNKGGYSLKYPLNWELIDCVEDKDCTIYINSGKKLYIGQESHEFHLYINKGNKGVKSYLDKSGYKYKTEMINGVRVYRTDSEPAPLGSEVVFFEKTNNSYISVGFSPYSAGYPVKDQEKYHEIYNKILSTFKFLK